MAATTSSRLADGSSAEARKPQPTARARSTKARSCVPQGVQMKFAMIPHLAVILPGHDETDRLSRSGVTFAGQNNSGQGQLNGSEGCLHQHQRRCDEASRVDDSL
jgi:hypothetical protein